MSRLVYDAFFEGRSCFWLPFPFLSSILAPFAFFHCSILIIISVIFSPLFLALSPIFPSHLFLFFHLSPFLFYLLLSGVPQFPFPLILLSLSSLFHRHLDFFNLLFSAPVSALIYFNDGKNKNSCFWNSFLHV